jgi:hypothetical protein
LRAARVRGGLSVPVLVLVALAPALAACERASHENLDRWLSTEKGVDKLREAVRDPDLSTELRAHAAQNLIIHVENLFPVAKEALEDMDDDERREVMVELAPRLWESARIAREKDVPTPVQAQAKDALYELRGLANDDTRRRIDGYLVEWLAGGYYEGRATVGRVSGRTIVRQLGPIAAPKLLESARRLLIRPPDAEGARVRVDDELLVALASTGETEAAALLVDMVVKDYKDPTLPKRALAAMHEAYVQPTAGQPVSARPALVGQIDRLGTVARDENLPGVMNNDAVDLIAAVGPPECIPPFVELARLPSAQQAYRWVGIQRGLRCGGAQAVVPIVEAIPDVIPYERALLEKYVYKEILAAPGSAKVAEQARLLLASKSWVARVTGIEVLGALKQRATAAQDAERIRQLAKDRTVLKGWWGPQKDVPAGKKKPDPTLGRIAEEVAGGLQALAKGPESK